MSEIKLSNASGCCLVDEIDYVRLCGRTWRVRSDGYVVSNLKVGGKARTLYLHREVMDSPLNLEVDHINRNKLDNRRENLRVATRQQNARNRRRQSNNRSGFKGVVVPAEGESKFRAVVKVEGRYKCVGYYDTKEEAAAAYDSAATQYYGEFARLNVTEDLTVTYTLDYFIGRFEAIPEEQWCIKEPTDEAGRHDCWGHLGEVTLDTTSDEAKALYILVAKHGSLTQANDGVNGYVGNTPKQRVLNFLNAIKEKNDENE